MSLETFFPLDCRQFKKAQLAGLRKTLTPQQADGCCVATCAPTVTPRGIVHFLGGAFAGAAPQLLYPLLISLLAEAGFTVVATPYMVTFRHRGCAVAVHQASSTSTMHATHFSSGLGVCW